MGITRRSVVGGVGAAVGAGPWIIARAADTMTIAAYGGEFRATSPSRR